MVTNDLNERDAQLAELRRNEQATLLKLQTLEKFHDQVKPSVTHTVTHRAQCGLPCSSLLIFKKCLIYRNKSGILSVYS